MRPAAIPPGLVPDRRRAGAQDQQGELGYVWECTNNVLRAHAAAVREFRRIVPNGKIGMNLAIQWAEPRSDSEEDRVRGTAGRCSSCACAVAVA